MPKALAHVPVIANTILTISISSIVAAVLGKQYLFNIPWNPHISRDWQLWRFALQPFVFSNSLELFYAAMILYNCIPVERIYGSKKFMTLILSTSMLNVVLQFFLLWGGSRWGLTHLPAGSFAVISSVIYQFYYYIPSASYSMIFGFRITPKTFIYFLYIQLAISQGVPSLLSCLCGIASGQAFLSNFLGIRKFRIPLLSKLLPPSSDTPLTNSIPANFGSSFVQATSSAQISVEVTTTQTTANPTPAPGQPAQQRTPVRAMSNSVITNSRLSALMGIPLPARPTEQQIAMVMGAMPGTGRERAHQVLIREGGNVDRAVERLLETATGNN